MKNLKSKFITTILLILVNFSQANNNSHKVSSSYNSDLEQTKEAAENGDTVAQNKLGEFYQAGSFVSQDYTQAFKWFKKAANKNNPKAQYNLAYQLLNGLGAKKNNKKALEWFNKSAENKEPLALFALANIFATGINGAPQNISKAIILLEKASKLNLNSATLKLAQIYENGNLVEKNYTKSIEYYKIAAKNNDDIAQYKLAIYYIKEEQLQLAYNFAIQSEAQGNNNAKVLLAIYKYLKSEDDESKKATSINILKNASIKDPSYATLLGIQFYAEDNFEEAEFWMNYAAENNDVLAQFLLSTVYSGADNFEDYKDYSKAITWFLEAFKQIDHKVSEPLKSFMYIISETNDINISTYRSLVSSYFETSFISIFPDMINEVVSKENEASIIEILKNKIKLGDKNAELLLGLTCLLSNDENYTKQGMDMLILNANKGNVDAQLLLGYLFDAGDYIESDITKAKKWFNKAKDNGSIDALKALKELE